NHPPTFTLPRLYTGSWINHDFGIWIGGQDENKAWEALGRARKAIDNAKKQGNISEDVVNMAMESIFVAEGSDWFWWYGDKFKTDYAYEFDRLFRTHLKKVYNSLNMTVPDELLSPIRAPRQAASTTEPTCFIHPQIDGRLSYFGEWRGAGSITLGNDGGAMHFGASSLAEITYGFDLESFYIRIDTREGGFDAWDPDSVLKITISSEAVIIIDLIIRGFIGSLDEKIRLLKNGKPFIFHETGARCAVNKLVEMAIPFALLDSSPKDELTFYVEIIQNKLVRDRFPREGYIMIKVPDKDFERRLWLV
ncbi:MAG: hypothetical protein R6T90_06435, partial [Dissulfuribacterales bacterium]